MKVIAVTDDNLIVNMSVGELVNLAGFDREGGLEKILKNPVNPKNLVDIEDIPVSSIFSDAKKMLESLEIILRT